jgi:hypothetical protein
VDANVLDEPTASFRFEVSRVRMQSDYKAAYKEDS